MPGVFLKSPRPTRQECVRSWRFIPHGPWIGTRPRSRISRWRTWRPPGPQYNPIAAIPNRRWYQIADLCLNRNLRFRIANCNRIATESQQYHAKSQQNHKITTKYIKNIIYRNNIATYIHISIYYTYIHTIRIIYPCMGPGPAPCKDIWFLLCVYSICVIYGYMYMCMYVAILLRCCDLVAI